MRTINETFTDEEFEVLKKLKGERTWREFMLAISKTKNITTSGGKEGETRNGLGGVSP